uniref:ChaB-like protein n=4 Tax=Mamestra configurata nucleopolyhedrovirus TaxID=207830 RepID=A0A7G7Y995_NPVMC|nr:ChaB-like protein [Mamestra configurata nucleopolyhedrovirus A]UVZ34964.1 ChaB1 [Melanchra picta nucleopolyhedrovirus]
MTLFTCTNISVKMFHLNESFYKQEMPARAKRLFVRTFNKYHKLDGGDEEVALHMARQAVDREYVMLNNHWIPKTAAEEIVRHDIDEDSLSESEGLPSRVTVAAPAKQKQRQQQKQTVSHKRSVYQQLSESDGDYSTDDDDEDATSESDADDVGSQSHIKNKLLFK